MGPSRIFIGNLLPAAAIRGGIPICFPVFGPPPAREPYLNLKQHGFARNVTWTFDGVEEGTDWIQARFSLNSKNSEVQNVFKPDFEAAYRVKIHRRSLITSLEITNPGQSDLEIQALLHTYLRLPPQSLPRDVRLKSLKGLKFIDKVANGNLGTEEREEVDFLAGEVDRVYSNVPSEIEVSLGNANRLTIKTEGLPDLTVWNPHEVKSNAMADMESDGWKKFVCVEPGQTNFVTLKPLGSWKGSQELDAHL